MAVCPFCNNSIDADLERLGGPCPHCFNEIPGEEAATDPGVELKKAQAQAEAQQEKKQRLTSIGIAALVLLLVGSGGGWFAWQKHQDDQRIAALMSLEFEDMAMVSVEELQAREEELRQAEMEAKDEETRQKLAEERARLAAARAQKQKEEQLVDFGGFGDRDHGDLAGEGEGTAGGSGTPDAGLGTLGSIDIDINVGNDLRVERGAGLKGNSQNVAVLQRLFKQKSGDITRCWETAAPGLKGRWVLSAQLQLDGTLSKVRFEPEQGDFDADFQKCVTNKVNRWSVSEKTDTVTDYSQAYTF